VDKSAHTLSLYSGGTWLKYYHVELGDSGLADKQAAGDHKTPEGSFYVTQKTVFGTPDYYLGSRWMRLSYPNREDAQRGLNAGLVDQSVCDQIVSAISRHQTPPQWTPLGGGIGIHGGDRDSFQDDWTWGCVGLTDQDVEDFYDFVKVGTPVTIVP
jgi:murein L,D-transpeptidase YafK